MDDFNNEGLGYLFIILGAVSLLIAAFILSYIRLARFKSCYDNNFKFHYCEKYKNY